MNSKAKRRIAPILEMYGIEKQNFQDFLNACPYGDRKKLRSRVQDEVDLS